MCVCVLMLETVVWNARTFVMRNGMASGLWNVNSMPICSLMTAVDGVWFDVLLLNTSGC